MSDSRFTDSSNRSADPAQSPNRSYRQFNNDVRRAENRYQGNRGHITSRPSRESIIESYAAQDAARARNARMVSQERYRSYQESSARARMRESQRAEINARRREEERMGAQRRQMQRDLEAAQLRSDSAIRSHSFENERSKASSDRAIKPLTTQESYANTRMSMEAYERERASRDALSRQRASRTTNREVIDGRGSVDSRAFNEMNKLVGYSIDERDRPQPAVDSSNPKAKWLSQSGQSGDDGRIHALSSAKRAFTPRREQSLPLQGNLGIKGASSFGHKSAGGPIRSLPLFVKIAVPVIIVLFVILMIILFR